jgi:hypothetical protein
MARGAGCVVGAIVTALVLRTMDRPRRSEPLIDRR